MYKIHSYKKKEYNEYIKLYYILLYTFIIFETVGQTSIYLVANQYHSHFFVNVRISFLLYVIYMYIYIHEKIHLSYYALYNLLNLQLFVENDFNTFIWH